MNVACHHCSAQHFRDERAGKQRNVFLQCCHNGKITLPPAGNNARLSFHDL